VSFGSNSISRALFRLVEAIILTNSVVRLAANSIGRPGVLLRQISVGLDVDWQ
jgi:hypothetical protein